MGSSGVSSIPRLAWSSEVYSKNCKYDMQGKRMSIKSAVGKNCSDLDLQHMSSWAHPRLLYVAHMWWWHGKLFAALSQVQNLNACLNRKVSFWGGRGGFYKLHAGVLTEYVCFVAQVVIKQHVLVFYATLDTMLQANWVLYDGRAVV